VSHKPWPAIAGNRHPDTAHAVLLVRTAGAARANVAIGGQPARCQ
jgi:hypothetical protein